MEWILILIGWIGFKVNGLILIGWVGPKVNGLDLRSVLDPNRLG